MVKSLPEKEHATFSASGAYRWLACPGSIKLSLDAPRQPDSVYAAEGTLAHSCLEAILKSDRPLKTECELRDEHGDEMLDHVMTAVDWVKRELQDGGTLLVETRVDASPFTRKGEFGTLDVAIVRLFDELIIMDYKHGAGVSVEVEDNPQLMYYALGLAHRYDLNFEKFRLVVAQPRCEHESGPIRELTVDSDTMKTWHAKFQAGVKTALAKAAELSAGEHCRWCPAKSICPEISTKALRDAQFDFTPVKETAPAKGLSPEGIAKILTAKPKIEAWLDEVASVAYSKAVAGVKIPGFKLVAKQARRQWNDAAKASKDAKRVFGDIAFDLSLKSPAELEKLTADAKPWVARRCSEISSGDTLVPETDKRSTVAAIEDDFSPVIEETKVTKRRK